MTRPPTPLIAPVPVTYVVPGEATSPRFGAAFAAGCGGRCVSVSHGLQLGDFASFCTPPTWSLLAEAQQSGRDWYYGDHAFFGASRGRRFRVSRNAYQYQPTPESLRAATPAAFRQLHISPHPEWRRNTGTSIVICPNSPGYMQRFGIHAHEWTMAVADQLGRLTDRPLVIRWKAQARARPLYVDLHDAWAVVVFDSASAIEAIVAGVPVFVLAAHASARSMGLADLTQIESPAYPAMREPFLWDLAAHQWSIDELRSGIAWKALHVH